MPTNRFTVILLTLCCIALGGCGAYFGTTLPDNLRERGIAADAAILDIRDTGWTVNDDPVIALHVRVQPADRPAFDGMIARYIVSRIALPQYQPGRTIRVRFDPADPSSIAVDTAPAQAPPDAATAAALARIRDPGVLRLQTRYELPDVPPALRGLKIALTSTIAGVAADGRPADSGCRQASVLLFDQLGWYVAHDASEPHDLTVHAECSTSATFLSADGGTYVLLPPSTAGMRVETPAGELLVQLQPVARTLACPDGDQARCAQLVRDYAAAATIGQIVRSDALLEFVRRRQASVR